MISEFSKCIWDIYHPSSFSEKFRIFINLFDIFNPLVKLLKFDFSLS